MPITVSGTSITFNDATVQTTAGQPGTVTSVATGNGLSGGTITTTGTLTVACPTYNSVGSYAMFAKLYTGSEVGPNAGQDMSSVGAGGIRWATYTAGACPSSVGIQAFTGYDNLSGTWRNMGGRVKSESGNNNNNVTAGGIACRVA